MPKEARARAHTLTAALTHEKHSKILTADYI